MRYSSLLNQELLIHSENSVDDILSTFYAVLWKQKYNLPAITNGLLVSSLFYETLITKKLVINDMEVKILDFMRKVNVFYNDLSNNIFPDYPTYLSNELGKLFDEKDVKDRYTNQKLIEELCRKLPKGVFKNPNHRFLDLNSENGIVSLYIFNKLMKGLIEVIPDPYERMLNILNNQLFIVNESPLFSLLLIYLFNPKGVLDIKLNFICGKVLDTKLPRVDYTIMNPPINDGIYEGKSLKQKGLYYKYILKAYEASDVIVTTLTDKFVASKSGGNFKDIYYSPDFGLKSESIINSDKRLNFTLSIALIDKSYKESYYLDTDSNRVLKDRCIDTSLNFIDKSDIFLKIVQKLYKCESTGERIVSKIQSNLPHGIRINSNDDRLEKNGRYKVLVNKKLEKENKNFITFDEELLTESTKKFKVAITKNIGTVDRSGNLTKSSDFKCYKISPYELYTNTYMAYIADTKSEQKSIYSYLNCDLIKVVVNQLRRSINLSKTHFKMIPIIDKETIWTNDKLYRHIGLSKKEIGYLSTKIKK